MLNVFKISQSLPLKAYWQSDDLNTSNYSSLQTFDHKVNNRTIDEDFYIRNIPELLAKTEYFQPYQTSDTITLQWGGELINATFVDYRVNIINCEGEIVKQLTPTCNTNFQLYTGDYLWHINIPLADFEEGKYLIQIHRAKFITPDVYFIFEPIDVKEYHKDTILIRYKNSVNDYGVYFEDGGITHFEKRIKAKITEFNPRSKFNVYDDQVMNLEMLGGVAYREWLVEFNQLPIWEIDKLERIFLFDSVKLDSNYYTRTEGSTIELTPNKANYLQNCKLKVREQFNKDSLIVDDIFTFKIATIPTGQYFYINAINIGSLVSVSIQNYFKNIQSLLINLNNYFNGVYTFHVLNETDIYVRVYTDNERDDILANGCNFENLFTNYLELDIDTQAEVYFELSITDTNNINYAFFYNDGTTDINLLGTNTSTITHTYPVGKKYTSYLFYNSATEIVLGQTLAWVEGLGGILGENVVLLSLEFTGYLKYIKNNLFKYSKNIENVFLEGQLLDSMNVSKCIIYLYTVVENNVGGMLQLDQQTPNAGMNNDIGVLKMKEDLEKNNWQIII